MPPYAALRLLEKLEGSLLGNIASLAETGESLEARRVLLLADNATVLGLHEVLLCQATGRVLGGTVPHLSGTARGGNLRATLLAILTRGILTVLASGVHFYSIL